MNLIMKEDYWVVAAEFMFECGNYSCDCNKSLLIQEYCDPTFKEMKCGDKIELVDIDSFDKDSNSVNSFLSD